VEEATVARAGLSPATRAGRFLAAQSGPDGFRAFHPKPLPPDPPLELSRMQALLDRANQALGRLDGVTLLLPDPDHLLYAYLRKEAVLSAQIEGTQSSLSDLLLFEHDAAPGVPLHDVREASNYLLAMHHALGRLAAGEPLSVRLLRDVHRLLLRDVRGAGRAPGEFRRVQNWIGGTRPANARFVPPPPQEVTQAMSDLEKFLHDRSATEPGLVRAALAHAQFETIHPFLDGNGRLGRLLVTLLLCTEHGGQKPVLSRPMLYLSLYLKRHRDAYYESLQRTRTEGAWEDWLVFFLEGIVEVAELTTTTTQEIVRLVEADRERIHGLGRAASSAQQVHDLLAREVVVTVPDASRRLPLTEPTVGSAIRHLQALGIAREITGRRRGRIYAYDEYLAILSEGTEQD
jgi:Fic family protein